MVLGSNPLYDSLVSYSGFESFVNCNMMAAGGGFTFGLSPAPAFGATSTGFGGATQGTTSGFSFGGSGNAAPATGGFSFGGAPKTTTAATGGFSFGNAAKTTAATGGFSFGSSTPASSGFGATPNTGFSFGASPATTTAVPNQGATATGFSMGGQTATPAPAMGGFSFNTPTSNPAPTGFSLGSTGTTGFGATGGGGFSFGTPAAATTAAAATSGTTANTGFNFGNPASTGGFGNPASTGGFGSFAGTPAAAAPPPTATTTASNWLLGAKPQSTVAPTTNTLGSGTTGSFFGQQPTTSGLGGFGTTTTTSSSLFGSFSFGKTTAATGLTSTTPATGFSFSGLSGTPATTSIGFGVQSSSLGGGSGFGLGTSGFGLFSTTTSTTSITGSIPSSQIASKGLGGVDPKVSIAASDGTGPNGKQANSKVLKETQLPQQLLVCVEPLKKYIKSEKAIRENISRMSTKSMIKVQTDLTALRQILGSVSNGVQRNAVLIEKLKKESVQELKNTEMGQRTEDMSAVLQDENVAPTDYFQGLFEDFEIQMKAYKGEIQNLESHILSLHQPSRLSPEELTMLLHKSHENFLALAAHFHQVHESVKTLKEKYLNYRRIFLGDTKDVFESKRKLTKRLEIPGIESQQGPNPFTGFPSTTAIALAAALSRNQQAPSGPPNIGLGTNTLGQHRCFGTPFNNQGSLFGSTGTGTTFGTSMNNASLFGNSTPKTGFSCFGQGSTSGFSFGSNTAAVKPLGTILNTPGSIFGTSGSTTTQPGLLGTQPNAATGAAFSFNNLSTTQPNFATGDGQQLAGGQNRAFQLQKPPPPASKRGKR
ncbi:nucleoporin p58/p45 isoform X2 [Octopus sinensis]|uniref:Nucleoporin p58/p45 isoform X2 n=1 Tax=Octopus sinensis TaxID=2607531 RepID=A0A6P7T1Q8_9MOLL|nr:nucleoporin p58/p45 isoform X2 [Octopus sinensis]